MTEAEIDRLIFQFGIHLTAEHSIVSDTALLKAAYRTPAVFERLVNLIFDIPSKKAEQKLALLCNDMMRDPELAENRIELFAIVARKHLDSARIRYDFANKLNIVRLLSLVLKHDDLTSAASALCLRCFQEGPRRISLSGRNLYDLFHPYSEAAPTTPDKLTTLLASQTISVSPQAIHDALFRACMDVKLPFIRLKQESLDELLIIRTSIASNLP